MVYGESNPIMGNIVCANIYVAKAEDKNQLRKKIQIHCKKKLQQYKVPVKIKFSSDIKINNRQKKIRSVN